MDCYNFNDTFLLLPNAMSTITIHQLEPDITQQLEQRAAQHGRTIELEIKATLKSVLVPKNPFKNCSLAPLAPQFWGEPYLSPPELGDLGAKHLDL